MKKLVLGIAFLASLSVNSVFAQEAANGGMPAVMKAAAIQAKISGGTTHGSSKDCVLSTIGNTLNSLGKQGLTGNTIAFKSGANAITKMQSFQTSTCEHVPGITVSSQEGIAVVTITSSQGDTRFNAWNKDGYILCAKLNSNFQIE